MTVRAAAPTDAAQVARVSEHVFVTTYGAAIPAPILATHVRRHFTPAAVKRALTAGDSLMMVAVSGAEIAGYVKLKPFAPPPPNCVVPQPCHEIVTLYVAPAAQGLGVGTALMAAARHAAVNDGVGALWLCTWRENTPALAFYQKWGFVRAGTTTVWVDSIPFADFVLVRPVDPSSSSSRKALSNDHDR